MSLSQETAVVIGLKALTWLAGNDTLLPVFLGSTGAGADDVRARAEDPDFLGSVLDFILMDDAWVLEFAQAQHVNPAEVGPARQALPGGESVHWT